MAPLTRDVRPPILIVEDKDSLRTMLKVAIEGQGHVVAEAVDQAGVEETEGARGLAGRGEAGPGAGFDGRSAFDKLSGFDWLSPNGMRGRTGGSVLAHRLTMRP